jgi:hypothetical protein
MSLKTLGDRRLLVLWLGVGFIGCTLLMSELGCGQLGLQKYGVPESHNFVGSGDVALDTNQVRTPCTTSAAVLPASARTVVYEEEERATGFHLRGGAEPGAASAPEKPKPGTAPTVWNRDRRRPSFARVYVGDGNSLELVSIHVSVVVDGPARSSTRCRPAPAPATSPCSSARRATRRRRASRRR